MKKFFDGKISKTDDNCIGIHIEKNNNALFLKYKLEAYIWQGRVRTPIARYRGKVAKQTYNELMKSVREERKEVINELEEMINA